MLLTSKPIPKLIPEIIPKLANQDIIIVNTSLNKANQLLELDTISDLLVLISIILG